MNYYLKIMRSIVDKIVQVSWKQKEEDLNTDSGGHRRLLGRIPTSKTYIEEKDPKESKEQPQKLEDNKKE